MSTLMSGRMPAGKGPRRALRRTAAALAAAMIAGCAAWMALGMAGCCTIGLGRCTITDRFTLAGADELNSCGGDEQSHPVAVRFYALKSGQKFQDSTFEDIWNDPGQALGGDLVGEPGKYFVQPGGREVVSLVRADGVTAVGVLANFCDRNDNTVRRHLFSLGKGGAKRSLTLRGINLTAE